jgi:hypothetical protein
MNELIQIPCILDSFKSLIHGSLKITFETQENLNPELLSKILAKQHQFGWLLFNPDNKIDENEIKLPEIKRTGKMVKSPSLRLRNVLFLIHQKKGGNKEDFEQYYNMIMEELINKYKNLLN